MSLYRAMSNHLLKSIQRAMLDQARLTDLAIANTRAARKESFLSRLPPRFSSTSKTNLHGSVMDSEFLFEDSRVDKAIAQAEKAASVSFTEATAKSLVKPRPKPHTPLVEKNSRPSTSYVSRPRAGFSQHPSTRDTRFLSTTPLHCQMFFCTWSPTQQIPSEAKPWSRKLQLSKQVCGGGGPSFTGAL